MLFRPKLLILSGAPIAHSATLRSGLASPRRAQSPPSSHILPNDSQICLHHRHSLTPTKVLDIFYEARRCFFPLPIAVFTPPCLSPWNRGRDHRTRLVLASRASAPLFRCLADPLPSKMSASGAPPTIAPPPEENHSDSSKLRIFIGILKK